MKIYSFDWEDDDPVFDFKLLGLSSTIEKDYDLAFFFNKYFGFTFSRIKDQEILEANILYNFSVYRFYHLETKQEIELISNFSHPQILKIDNFSLFDNEESIKILIPEYKSYNFFIKSNFLLNEEFYVTLQGLEVINNFEKIDIEKININNLENLILPT